MSLQTIPNDVHIGGRITAQSMTVPASTISDSQVASDAAIQATKVVQEIVAPYAQEATANAAAEERVIFIARNAGTVAAVECGHVTKPDTALAAGRSAIVNVKKNGTTILSATVELDNADNNLTAVPATISTPTYADGDIFTVAITLGAGTSGTHCKGVFANVRFRETPTT